MNFKFELDSKTGLTEKIAFDLVKPCAFTKEIMKAFKAPKVTEIVLHKPVFYIV
jgi:hypothetical protein